MNQFVRGEATILGVTTVKVGFRQLDNLALNGSKTDALLLYQTLATAEGVQIEFPPEPLGRGPTHHMMFYIPGGIRMELITPAS